MQPDYFDKKADVKTYSIKLDILNDRLDGSYHDPISMSIIAVYYTHLRAHETVLDLVCRLLLEKKKNNNKNKNKKLDYPSEHQQIYVT